MRYDPIEMRPVFDRNIYVYYPTTPMNSIIISIGILRINLTWASELIIGDAVLARYAN